MEYQTETPRWLVSTMTIAERALQNPKSIHFRLLETRINQHVKGEIVDKFWSHFKIKDRDSETYRPYKVFIEAIEFLSDACKSIEQSSETTNQRLLKEKIFHTLKSHILSNRPHDFNDFVEATYCRGFKAYLDKNLEDLKKRAELLGVNCDNENGSDGEYVFCSDGRCIGCKLDDCVCMQGEDCGQIYESFCRMNDNLRNLQLLDLLVGDIVMDVARSFIERRVAMKCKSNYSCSYLAELTNWVNVEVKTWISEIYRVEDIGSSAEINQKLDQSLNDAYADVRVAHMFEIIIEFPNSEAAIQDLKLCLEQSTTPSFRLNLIDIVKQSLVESLLHPGVNTYDILTAYISAIKALRALDPSGLILQLVTEPVRKYLKSRSDTVRCIVTALTDEDHNSELNREMIRSSAQTNENGLDGKNSAIEMNLPTEGEKCTATNFEKWKPDPIKLNSSDDVMKTSRFSDIVSILVNIYETKDLFVEEYQKLLSQRLLNKYDEGNLETEHKNLQLLTLRFSDCELHRCEVMLKDVERSKRINKRILEGEIRDHKLEEFRDLDVLIVSSPFWPEKFSPIATLYDEPPKITFPKEIQTAMDTYTKAFEALQASRTLHWRHHLGSVNMDVTINGKAQNFNVSPLHAALLCMFKDKKVWRIHELIQETSLTAATIRSRLALWQRNGLIRDCGEDKFELILE